MKISNNELTAALKKAFEGIGFSVGDYEDAAAMVAWLETHGLQGLAQIHCALPHLIEKPYLPAALNHEDASLAVVDAHGGSTMICGSQAMDLAYAKARNIGLGRVQLSNCHNRKFIIERLVNTARRGMACMAYWRHSGGAAVYSVVGIDAGEEYPTYVECAAEQCEVENDPSLFILCGPSFSALQEYLRDTLPDSSGDIVRVTPEAMAFSYSSTLEHGIEIDVSLWESLEKLVKNVLVEATETSRAGAGE